MVYISSPLRERSLNLFAYILAYLSGPVPISRSLQRLPASLVERERTILLQSVSLAGFTRALGNGPVVG